MEPNDAVTYDAEQVASLAMQADPSVTQDDAVLLAVEAWRHLSEIGEPDAPEVARRLLAAHDHVAATTVNHIAHAAVEFCEQHGVQLGG